MVDMAPMERSENVAVMELRDEMRSPFGPLAQELMVRAAVLEVTVQAEELAVVVARSSWCFWLRLTKAIFPNSLITGPSMFALERGVCLVRGEAAVEVVREERVAKQLLPSDQSLMVSRDRWA
jgi:hypothetical protein